MKLGCSSESFARAIETGDLTHIEWLDICANELELDGIAFTLAHFPRTDPEYLAQLKKTCVDLGLTIAAVAANVSFWSDAESTFGIARTLGAPLIIAPPAPPGDDADAWGVFTEFVQLRAREAKAHNIPLAVSNAPGTLCPNAAALRRLAKDIDSAWLRYAPNLATLDDAAEAESILPKSAITTHTIDNLDTFATPSDREAQTLITRLARYRGFCLLEAPPPGTQRDTTHAYHNAISRFASLRADSLTAAAE